VLQCFPEYAQSAFTGQTQHTYTQRATLSITMCALYLWSCPLCTSPRDPVHRLRTLGLRPLCHTLHVESCNSQHFPGGGQRVRIVYDSLHYLPWGLPRLRLAVRSPPTAAFSALVTCSTLSSCFSSPVVDTLVSLKCIQPYAAVLLQCVLQPFLGVLPCLAPTLCPSLTLQMLVRLTALVAPSDRRDASETVSCPAP
jgi:hypothetical protein